METKNIFLTGASGYVGGTVLTALLRFPNKYAVTALVRKEADLEVLRKMGVSPVLGSLDELDLLTRMAKESDAVVHTAPDWLHSIQAIVEGLKSKEDKRAVLLHTSGTAVLKSSGGEIAVPFDDKDMNRIHSIPLSSIHREVDSWIFTNTEDITAAIIVPSTTHGIGTGPFKKNSTLISNLIRSAIERKQVGWVETRRNATCGHVSVHDLADLYLLVLEGLLSNSIPSGKEGGWYFGSVNEHTWFGLAEELGVLLHKYGLVDMPAVAEFEKKYVDKYFYGYTNKELLWGGDSRCVANRSKDIGWKPSCAHLYETLEQELQFVLENDSQEYTSNKIY